MREYLVIRFLGDNSVNIDELSIFLKNTSKFMKSVYRELDKEAKLNIEITAIEKGSFILNLKPIIDVLGATISMYPVIKDTKDFIEVITDFIKVVKFLEGKEPKEMTQTTITNYNDKVINIQSPTYYIMGKQDSNAFRDLGDMIESAPKNKNIEFYSNYNEDERIEVREGERGYFKDQNRESENVFRKTTCRTKVTVKKPSLDMKSKWTVYFDKVINVSIKDDEFSIKVKSGELSFKNGAELDVDLVVYHPVDDNSKLKPDYEIIKVYNV